MAVAAPPKASLRPRLRGEGFYKRAAREVEEILSDNGFTGDLAFALAQAESGAFLECRNEQMGTPPASVTKSLTALYALEALGPEHRFETRLLATGPLVDGAIEGDLILLGGYDPTLDTDGLAELASRLKEAGVIEVKGAFKVSHGGLPVVRQIDRSQPEQVGYNPAVGGIALNYNRVHFEWERENGDYKVTMEAPTVRYRPEVSFARMSVRDRSGPVYTFEDAQGRDNWTVARGALGKGGSRWLPVRRPALYAGDVFATLARSHGVVLKKSEVIEGFPEGETLATLESAPLRDILQDMLKFSNNLTAEMVGRAASLARGVSSRDLVGSAAEMNRWAIETLGMKAPQLVDHS
ncbi:MAG: D-alanyl-D-alanine carboxypeptidase/D-alanyl-D-alanine-endopeptidase, partial [Sulfitobacter sp.]|nr:D-alanyl-D-alanine carboxypeptidase/D-alanyl-D-alanine-endopeptidase [Sulfitobacter sp.]